MLFILSQSSTVSPCAQAWLGDAAYAGSASLSWQATFLDPLPLNKISVCMRLETDEDRSLGCSVFSATLEGSATYMELPTLAEIEVVAAALTYDVARVGITVEATSACGFTSTAQLLLLLDRSPPRISPLTATAFAQPADAYSSLESGRAGPDVVTDTVVRLELISGAVDDDLGDGIEISIAWAESAMDGEPI